MASAINSRQGASSPYIDLFTPNAPAYFNKVPENQKIKLTDEEVGRLETLLQTPCTYGIILDGKAIQCRFDRLSFLSDLLESLEAEGIHINGVWFKGSVVNHVVDKTRLGSDIDCSFEIDPSVKFDASTLEKVFLNCLSKALNIPVDKLLKEGLSARHTDHKTSSLFKIPAQCNKRQLDLDVDFCTENAHICPCVSSLDAEQIDIRPLLDRSKKNRNCWSRTVDSYDLQKSREGRKNHQFTLLGKRSWQLRDGLTRYVHLLTKGNICLSADLTELGLLKGMKEQYGKDGSDRFENHLTRFFSNHMSNNFQKQTTFLNRYLNILSKDKELTEKLAPVLKRLLTAAQKPVFPGAADFRKCMNSVKEELLVSKKIDKKLLHEVEGYFTHIDQLSPKEQQELRLLSISLLDRLLSRRKPNYVLCSEFFLTLCQHIKKEELHQLRSSLLKGCLSLSLHRPDLLQVFLEKNLFGKCMPLQPDELTILNQLIASHPKDERLLTLRPPSPKAPEVQAIAEEKVVEPPRQEQKYPEPAPAPQLSREQVTHFVKSKEPLKTLDMLFSCLMFLEQFPLKNAEDLAFIHDHFQPLCKKLFDYIEDQKDLPKLQKDLLPFLIWFDRNQTRIEKQLGVLHLYDSEGDNSLLYASNSHLFYDHLSAMITNRALLSIMCIEKLRQDPNINRPSLAQVMTNFLNSFANRAITEVEVISVWTQVVSRLLKIKDSQEEVFDLFEMMGTLKNPRKNDYIFSARTRQTFAKILYAQLALEFKRAPTTSLLTELVNRAKELISISETKNYFFYEDVYDSLLSVLEKAIAFMKEKNKPKITKYVFRLGRLLTGCLQLAKAQEWYLYLPEDLKKRMGDQIIELDQLQTREDWKGKLINNLDFLKEQQPHENSHPKKPLRDYQKKIKSDPMNPELSFQLGNCYFEQRDFHEAIKHYNRAISFGEKTSSPESLSLYYYQMAIAQENLHNGKEAIKSLLKLLNCGKARQQLLKENLLYIYQTLGKFFVRLLNKKEAIAYLEKAYQLENNLKKRNPTTTFQLAVCYSHGNDWKKARRLFEETLDLEPEANKEHTANYLINALIQLKEPMLALKAFEQALKYPKPAPQLLNLDYLKNLAPIYAEQQPERGIKFLTKLIEKYPDHPETWCARGIVYKKMGKTENALKDFEKAVELRGDDPYATDLLEDTQENFSG